jgi:hypothetical protein
MLQIVGRSMAIVGLAAMLLGSARPTFAGQAPLGSCCVCTGCASGATQCAAIADESECRSHCISGVVNATACLSEVVNASCASLGAECQLAGAPMLGTAGLTIVTLLLSAFGIVGLRRAARRQRA